MRFIKKEELISAEYKSNKNYLLLIGEAYSGFMDECYNTFVNDHGKLNGIKVESINLPEDIQYMLNVVSQTQTGKKLYEEPANTTTHRFQTVKEMTDWMKTICL